VNKHWLAGIIAMAGMACAIPARAQLVVIVNPRNPAASLSAEQVAQIFLGKSSSFPGGGTATPLNLAEGAALRDEFYAKVAEKNPGQVKAYWAKQMFSGKSSPPREVASAAEVRKAVAGDVSAIGYVDKAAVDSSVKAVLTVH
jgi:ABC-type phosphate transport system substrate-binding protein